jgi:hypothetical protein
MPVDLDQLVVAACALDGAARWTPLADGLGDAVRQAVAELREARRTIGQVGQALGSGAGARPETWPELARVAKVLRRELDGRLAADRPAPPRWSREKPAGPGWYFVRPMLEVVRVVRDGDRLAIDNGAALGCLELPDDAEWCRIPEPAEPEESPRA